MRDIFKIVPGTHTMEVVDFQAGDPRFEVMRSDGAVTPLGVTVAQLRERFGGDDCTITGPDGEQYQLSLAPWSASDPDTTYLHMSYRFTPNQPVRIDPRLHSAPADPKRMPAPAPSTQATGTTVHSSLTVTSGERIVRPGRMRFDVFGDVRYAHRLTIYPSDERAGMPVATLLVMSEVQVKEIPCPVCDGKVSMHVTLAERITDFINRDTSVTHLQLVMSHPADLPETKTSSEHSPIAIERLRRYAPTSEPQRAEIPGVDQYVAVKSHEHLVTIRPAKTDGENSPSAATLLHLPEARQSEIACPLCDTLLQFSEPLERFFTLFVNEKDADTTHIEWRIAHPESIPVTKTPPADAPIKSTRGFELSENESKLQDGYPAFFVVPASGV